jgi:alcohol dehydrogenase class IV
MEKKIYRGETSLQEFKKILHKESPKRIFLVRGAKSYKACGAKKIMDVFFEEVGAQVFEFFDFENNPKFDDMQTGLNFMRTFKPDMIIAAGGGSVLDMAKLLRFFYSYSGDPAGTEFRKQRELIPLFVLPATAGTGCEVTHYAVMYIDKKKYSVEHHDLLPDVVIIYPPFTYNNPAYLTACTGFDALAQAIEAYWSVYATNESDEYALNAIKLLYPNLSAAVNLPTPECRNDVFEGAFWAGKAIDITKTTAPHACSYFFTSFLGIPHGHAVALTFPFFIKYNAVVEPGNKSPLLHDHLKYNQKINKLFSFMHVNSESVDKMFDNYLLNISLRKDNLNHFSFDSFTGYIDIQRLQNNPKNISSETLQDLYTYLISEK